MTYFGPALDGSGRKATTLVKDHEHFIPTKFRKHPLSGSEVKGLLCVPMHIHALVLPPPFFHLNKYIEILLKFIKHLNLLYKHSSTHEHGNYTK